MHTYVHTRQLQAATSRRLVYGINLVHSTDSQHVQLAARSDKQKLLEK